MALDLEKLLTPVSDTEPSGPDLAYDPVRAEIEQAFERSISVDVTGAAATADDVDWRRIVKLIEEQSAQTKDIWLAVYLCRAGARASELDQILVGAQFLAGLCEAFWDSVHPQLEEYGFQGRKGPCESLAAVGEFLAPLRRVTLLRHPRLGAFSGLDFERFRAGGESEEGYGLFRAVLNETPEETLLAVGAQLDDIAAALRNADTIMGANADGETGPNLKATYDTLSALKRAVLNFTTTPAEEADSEGPAATGGEATDGPRLSGSVNSREDVLRALDAISDYYRRKEPGSPVPVVLQRAREWVNLDFLAVLADISPGGLDEAKRVLTFRKPDEY